MFRSSNNFESLTKSQANRYTYGGPPESRTYDNVFKYDDMLHPYGKYMGSSSNKSGQGQGGTPPT